MPLLTLESVSKSFGGVVAVKNVSLSVEAGEILGVMGPNGSGKTTLLNLVSGALVPDSGEIFFFGERINRLAPHQLCRRGLARTFQLVRPFLGLTALENVLVGLGYGRERMAGTAARDKAVELLDSVGLERTANRSAHSLTVMDRKRLELARALATSPKLLLLDEFMAGLTPAETATAINLIRRLHTARRSDYRARGTHRLGVTRCLPSYCGFERGRKNRRRLAGERGKRSACHRSVLGRKQSGLRFQTFQFFQSFQPLKNMTSENIWNYIGTLGTTGTAFFK